ncbi:transposase, MuDR, MULE transposase domain protein [Tanacetum coccineum]
MLHDMIMKKFKLEANYLLNLSAKMPSFDDIFDITDDNEIRTFMHCLCLLLIIDAAHLKGQYKGTKGMDGNNQNVPIAFGIFKGETGPCWSWWMSVLNECIGDSPNLLFISDRHAVIALAVHNEFPLAFHAVCCRHLMMSLSLKSTKTKGLFWEICKAYTPEEFSTEMSNLQAIQHDAYHKLIQVGPQRWSRAHCPLVRYNYMTSNNVESVNACTILYRKLPVLKLAETYRAMVQEWFTSPPGRKFVDELVATVDPVELDNFSTNQVKLILTNSLGYDFNSQTFLYLRNPNCSLDSGLIPLANAIQDRDIFWKAPAFRFSLSDRSKHGADSKRWLSRRIICRSMASSSSKEVRKTTVSKLQRELEAEATFANKLLCNLTRYREQNSFTNRRPEINRRNSLPYDPLIEYGRYALGCMTGSDMKKAAYLKSVRDELLRSMEEKRQLIANYREM